MTSISEMLRNAAQAIKSGDKDHAKSIIASVLKSDPGNADAWYLASFIFEDPDQKIKALERTLSIRPDHSRAKMALARLRPERTIDELLEAPLPSMKKRPVSQKRNNWVLFTVTFAVLGIIAVLIIGITVLLGTQSGRAVLRNIGVLPTDTPTTMPSPTATATPTPTPTATPPPTSTATMTSSPVPTPSFTAIPSLTGTPMIARGDRDDPMPIGEPIYLVQGENKNFVIKVLDVIRDDTVWQIIQKANQFNSPPGLEREYIMILVEVVFIEGPSSSVVEVDESDFKIVSRAQILDDLNLLAGLDQFALKAKLLPNGYAVGVLFKEVYKDDPGPLLVYGVRSDYSKGFYFSLTQSKPGYQGPFSATMTKQAE